MRVSKPKTRAIIEDAVAEIKGRGVEPTVDDILWLAHLAELMIQPVRVDALEVLFAPVKCGHARLYPRTIAGDLWLDQCASKWWPQKRRPLTYMIAELYALAHGHDEEAMMAVYSRATAIRKIMVWAAECLPVSYRQIEVALDQVAGRLQYVEIEDDDTVKASELSPVDWGEEIVLLCSVYRQPPRHFLYEISANQCMGMLKKAALAIGRPELLDKQADGDDAFGRFRLAVKEIIKRGAK